MMRSMTGFAHRDFALDGVSGAMELKSYNNRYLDLYLSLPPALSRFEPRVRALLADRVNRGKIEFSLRVRRFDLPVTVHADLEAARAVAATLRDIAAACGLATEPDLATVAGREGVLNVEKTLDEDRLWPPVESEILSLFAEFDASRLREGEATESDLRKELARLGAGLARIESAVPEIERTLRAQFETRLAEFVPQMKDENRVLAETAILLVKFGINEEMSRLKAHIAAFDQIACRDAAPGKKLDFLCQEMNREVNTIGSKNMLVSVAHDVVDMKDALENLREQLRNVE